MLAKQLAHTHTHTQTHATHTHVNTSRKGLSATSFDKVAHPSCSFCFSFFFFFDDLLGVLERVRVFVRKSVRACVRAHTRSLSSYFLYVSSLLGLFDALALSGLSFIHGHVLFFLGGVS